MEGVQRLRELWMLGWEYSAQSAQLPTHRAPKKNSPSPECSEMYWWGNSSIPCSGCPPQSGGHSRRGCTDTRLPDFNGLMGPQSSRGHMSVLSQKRQVQYLDKLHRGSSYQSVWPTETCGDDSSIMQSLGIKGMCSLLDMCCFSFMDKAWWARIWLRSPKWAFKAVISNS